MNKSLNKPTSNGSDWQTVDQGRHRTQQQTGPSGSNTAEASPAGLSDKNLHSKPNLQAPSSTLPCLTITTSEGTFQQAIPMKLIQFEVCEHEILKNDHVVYHLAVTAGGQKWTVVQRFKQFDKLNAKLVKNIFYKDKIPAFPPKRIARTSGKVIEERKKLLPKYMNQLAENINIFDDPDVLQFLRKQHDSNLAVQMRNIYVQHEIEKELLVMKQSQFKELSRSTLEGGPLSARASGGPTPNTANPQKRKTRNMFTADLSKLFGGQNTQKSLKKRGSSVNTKVKLPIPQAKDMTEQSQHDSHNKAEVLKSQATDGSQEQWALMTFDTMDQRIISFIDFLNSDPEHQSQLINDFAEYYFGQKPVLSGEHIQRLLHGSARQQGLLHHLKESHTETFSVKTKAIFTLFQQLMDNNKSHQPDEFRNKWRSQKPSFVVECNFDSIINQEHSLKNKTFELLSIYVEGRTYKMEDLITNEQALQKYKVWKTNKGRVQHSFASQSSAIRRSSRKEWANRRTTLLSSNVSQSGRKKSKRITQKLPGDGSYECHHSNHEFSIESPLGMIKNQSCINFFEGQKIVKPRKMTSGFRGVESGISGQDSSSYGNSNYEESSESDFFNNIPELQRVRSLNKGASKYVKLPREFFLDIHRDSEDFSIETRDDKQSNEPKHQNYDEDDQKPLFEHKMQFANLIPVSEERSVMFEFDLQSEVSDLIKKYQSRINRIYNMEEIENLKVRHIGSQINQYLFTQSEIQKCYKIKMQKLRMILEGAKVFETGRVDSFLMQFSFLKCQVVKEIDPQNKIVKFSYVRKFSYDYKESCQKSPEVSLGNINGQESSEQGGNDHYMLVSYSTTGQKDDKACISLFEVDMNRMMIAPSNFLIITQKIGSEVTNRTTHANQVMENYRTLSAVAEEPMEQEAGSFSHKYFAKNFNAKVKKESSQQLSKFNQPKAEEDDTEVNSFDGSSSSMEALSAKDEQSYLLIENTFERKKAVVERGTEFSLPKVSPTRPENVAEEIKLSAKDEEEKKVWQSMSTAKSSGASQLKERLGGALGTGSEKYKTNPFDDTLCRTHGDLSITMRIQHDHFLLEKLMVLFQSLSEKIHFSLHDIK